MSHFIIWSISAMYFGTPNGQASTQFEQPMQRGLSADCTMPSSVCLIASAGHTSAQVGSSQCMHTIGAVCVVVARSIALEVDQRPAAVGAALLHACTHASQPMQRLWSMTNTGLVVDAEPHAAPVQLESRASVVAAPAGRSTARRHLELGHLRHRVERAVRELVRGLARRASGRG